MGASVTGASTFIPAGPEISPPNLTFPSCVPALQLTTGGPLSPEQLPLKRRNALADGNLKTRSRRLTGELETMSAIPASQEEYDDVNSLVDRLLDENEALRVHLERVLARLDEISNSEHTGESDHAVGQYYPQKSEYQRPTQSREYQGPGYQGNDGWAQSPAAGVVERLFFADIERRVRRNEETLADLLTTMRALTAVR